jgi:hypothetical protein
MWFSTSGANKIICLLQFLLSSHGYLIGRAGMGRDGVIHDNNCLGTLLLKVSRNECLVVNVKITSNKDCELYTIAKNATFVKRFGFTFG